MNKEKALNATQKMKDELMKLHDDVLTLEKAIINNEVVHYSSYKRSAVKRGVIDLKYRITQLVKELYEN